MVKIFSNKQQRKKILLGIAGVIVLLFLFANRGFRTLIRQYFYLRYLEKQLAQLKKENQVLQQQLYYLETDLSEIERIARTKLNFIKKGEIIYRFAPRK